MTITTVRYGEFVDATLQSKPWGHEVIFATGENNYVGKLITVRAGESLSLQYHDEKDETISVLTGEAQLEHGPSVDDLRIRMMRPGHTVHLSPRVLHRLTAIVDTQFVEVSTAALGWRQDVVRLSDRYGRSGTNAP